MPIMQNSACVLYAIFDYSRLKDLKKTWGLISFFSKKNRRDYYDTGLHLHDSEGANLV